MIGDSVILELNKKIAGKVLTEHLSTYKKLLWLK
jgi:hypothetical protein